MALTLGMFRFQGEATAARVLQTLREAHAYPWLPEVGLIERHKSGRVSMRATYHGHAFEEEEGEIPLVASVIGGLTGGLIGLFAGPGLVLGVIAGGAAGAAIGAVDEFTKEDTIYGDLKQRLEKDSSALLLLADEGHVEALGALLEDAAPEVVRREIPDAVVGKLETFVRHRV
jgi:uncharacterized membrane protein